MLKMRDSKTMGFATRNIFQSRSAWNPNQWNGTKPMTHVYCHPVLPCNYTQSRTVHKKFELRPFLPHPPKVQGTTTQHVLTSLPTHLRLSGTRVRIACGGPETHVKSP